LNLLSAFRPSGGVPAGDRSNFLHLYGDIAWYGLFAASSLAYVTVYAARLGASGFQIGLLTAGPGVVNLVLTLPAGRWLEKQPMNAAVFWTSVLSRLSYLPWVFLPWLLFPQAQIQAIIVLTLLASIPGTPLAVAFNAMFAEAVPAEWRGHVVGIRNALLSLTYIVVSLLCGQLLVRIPFPTGYQVVFAIGFLGAAMSSLHLWYIVPIREGRAQPHAAKGLGSLVWPTLRAALGQARSLISPRRPGARPTSSVLTINILRGPYGKLMALLFAFYAVVYLSVPLGPIFWVDQLSLTDSEIGLGTAVFYVSVFLGSTQVARLARTLGNHRLTAIGALVLATYPGVLALSQGLGLFLVANAGGGLGSALLSGGLLNYLLEKIPEDRRPAYFAWWNVALNAALLVGSLAGPLLADATNIRAALAVAAVLRVVAALAILRWG
jgi:hypothetical protein